MQKIFREIIEELKSKARIEGEKCAEWVQKEDADNVARYNHGEYCYLDSIHTVERFIKKSDMGWISCDERYPDSNEYVLLSFENFSVPIIGRYEEDEDGGAFYAGDKDKSLVSHGLVVNAWQKLPEPYQGKECNDSECPFHRENGCPAAEGCPGFEGNEHVVSNGDKIRSMSDEELADAMLEFDEIEMHIPFCGKSSRCEEILDAGETILDGMCRECMLKWLRAESK